MIVGSTKEDLTSEKRISLTPETAKNIIGLGLKVCIEKNYANHLGIDDDQFKAIGVEIKSSSNEVINSSNLIIKVNCPSENEISILKENTILIGMFDPNKNKNQIDKIISKKIKIFSLELLPRITRAQSMDVLSSQSNLAGYRAVVDCVSEFEKAVPMMMTAAGTVPAAKVLVIGAGVAGLQAIATAKRLGAIVSATDVRAASKEQVESLGGKFLSVEDSENMETTGGYAKETSADYKKQAEMMKDALKKNDIVICTALIPGKPAPRILTEDLVKLMKPGSIVYDLAAEQGGNSAFSEAGKINNVDGIKIIGVKKLMNSLPLTASSLYAKNLFSFIRNLYSREKKDFYVNLEDEIIENSLIKKSLKMEIDPFIFRLSIFILSIFIGYYVVWSVTPSLHTPLMSVTNAISSVIIVGAIIAALAGSSDKDFDVSSIFGFLAIVLAAINIFGGFLVTQRMLQMYKKRKKRRNDICKLISAFLFSFWDTVYSCAKRAIVSRYFKARKLFWYCRNGNCNSGNFLDYWKFFSVIGICNDFFGCWWSDRSIYSI